jgi:ubiquinone/menaquinone biosynthesis C-methylase UbiE
MAESQQAKVQAEFARAAEGFAERTVGRFDDMDVLGFSELPDGASVLEVGAGTGNFLQLFEPRAARLLALDLTTEMLVEARSRHPRIEVVVGDGAKLPFPSKSIDLVMSAQALHHIWEPLPILKEMRRVVKPDGRIMLVDQVSIESYEKTAFMNHLELIRDPSHATSRPPSAFRLMVRAAGLKIEKEKLWVGPSSFSKWMWPGEFPQERIDAVREAIEKFGVETGMDFVPDGDDFTFTRRRIMLLASRA